MISSPDYKVDLPVKLRLDEDQPSIGGIENDYGVTASPQELDDNVGAANPLSGCDLGRTERLE